MKARSPLAAIIRNDIPDCVYQFREADAFVQGSWEEWDRLESQLAKYFRDSADRLHPPGAAVGAFDYEGNFAFYLCPEFDVVSTSTLTMEPPREMLLKEPGLWRNHIEKSRFCEMVQRAKDYIRTGDIYQVNLARRISCPAPDLDDFLFFKTLWTITEAPWSAYLRFPGSSLISSSPECFIDLQGRAIRTQPIKGTRPRYRDPIRDEQSALELSTDPKEVAELVMITDLERNDLGQVSEFGSVVVRDLVKRVAFSHVFHLVSTVEGILRKDVSPVQAIRACFPGGSITGAPKIRARQIISELEPEKRGFYTGAIGYFGFDGSARFNIAIRTCEHRNEELSFFVGAGITSDSVPEMEYQETEDKAQGIKQAFTAYSSHSKTVART